MVMQAKYSNMSSVNPRCKYMFYESQCQTCYNTFSGFECRSITPASSALLDTGYDS